MKSFLDIHWQLSMRCAYKLCGQTDERQIKRFLYTPTKMTWISCKFFRINCMRCLICFKIVRKFSHEIHVNSCEFYVRHILLCSTKFVWKQTPVHVKIIKNYGCHELFLNFCPYPQDTDCVISYMNILILTAISITILLPYHLRILSVFPWNILSLNPKSSLSKHLILTAENKNSNNLSWSSHDFRLVVQHVTFGEETWT